MKEKVLNLSRKLVKHELISGSLYLFIGTTIANFLAFLFNLFLARKLVPSDYGIYVSLLSIITLLGVPVASLSQVIVKFATGYFAKEQFDKAAKLYKQMFIFLSIVMFILLLLFVIFSNSIGDFLHIKNTSYVIFTGIIIYFSYLSLVNSAYIQSLLKFGFLSFINVSASLLKLFIGGFLVLSGFKIAGALGGIFIMVIVTFVGSFLPLRLVIGKIKNNTAKISVKEIIYFALPASFAIFFLTSFISTDVILVKHFFSPRDAGFYAGLSLIGKVIFYFTGPIPVVMFPLLVKRHSLGKNLNSIFYLALFLVFLPSFAITAFYFLFPSFVINLFLGGKSYIAISPYLGLFGIYLSIFSLVNICVSFFLSLNKMKIVPVVVIAAILQAVLISFFHSNFYQVIGVSLIISFVLLVILVIAFLRMYGSVNKIRKTVSFLNTSSI